jgi:hypothetical protein
MIDRANTAVLRPAPVPDDDAALELAVGDEIIEVRVDRAGIHFRHPQARSGGSIPWDMALALSLLPDEIRRGELGCAGVRPQRDHGLG